MTSYRLSVVGITFALGHTHRLATINNVTDDNENRQETTDGRNTVTYSNRDRTKYGRLQTKHF